MHDRIRDTFLGAWGRTVARHPWPTLLIAVALAAGAVVLAYSRLQFRSDRSDLIDADLEWNRAYATYKSRFHRWDDLVVVIEGDRGDARIDALARDLAASLRSSPQVRAADAGFRDDEAGPRFFAVAPDAEFDAALAGLADGRDVAAATTANEGLATALGRLRQRENDAGSLDALDAFLAPYLAALRGEEPDFAFLTAAPAAWRPFVDGDGSGRLRFVQVQFRDHTGSVDSVTSDLTWLRDHTRRFIAQSGIGGIDWGVTGVPAIEADETAQSIKDSTLSGLLAFALCTALLVAAYRSFVIPALAAICFCVGLAWSFGWLVLSVGHLQLLSVVFTSILIGLGMDFAVHIHARLELLCDEHDDLPSAMDRVFRAVGPGMLTGAVTTAAAFGVTVLTKFRGMAEMGIIAGGGIVLCLIAMLCCFPAALAATGRWKRLVRHRAGGEGARFAHGWFDVIDFHPRAALVVAGIAVVLLVLPALRVRYDPNILNLQPRGIESVRWEQRIVAADSHTAWAALVQTSAEQAGALVDALRARPEVSDVGGMGTLVRPDRAERARRIAEIAAAPARPAPADPGPEGLVRQLAPVQVGIARRAEAETGETATRLAAVADELRSSLAAFRRLAPEEQAARSARLETAFALARLALAQRIDAALAPIAPGPDDLPAVLREQWTFGDVWLLEVEPAADPLGRSILDPDRLGAFVASLRTVAADVHGPPVQIYESSLLIQREYIRAAVYAIAAILVLLLIDFRSLADSLCALLPVTIGFGGVFGLMGLTGVPLNFANIIVLPLIFGIGVDVGVHAVHRWRSDPFGRPAGLSGGTGRGITVTTLTTLFGFGAMFVAEHRGIRSLGFVMVAGLTVTLLACYLVLPAVLRLRTSHWLTSGRTGFPELPPARHLRRKAAGRARADSPVEAALRRAKAV
jgi:hypothetical protein